MDRRVLVVGALALAALLIVANAAAFAYRWLSGTVTVAGPEAARGAACTGFYSSANQTNITLFLPDAGTNYNAATYGTNTISVRPGDVVCEFGLNGAYKLYESISVTMPITVGSWYIKDFYGFGYYGTATDPQVTVTLVVEDAITATEIPVTVAKLLVYKGTTKVTELDLAQAGSTATFTLNPGEGVQLDLFIDAQDSGQATFKVGFYVSQSSEQPR